MRNQAYPLKVSAVLFDEFASAIYQQSISAGRLLNLSEVAEIAIDKMLSGPIERDDAIAFLEGLETKGNLLVRVYFNAEVVSRLGLAKDKLRDVVGRPVMVLDVLAFGIVQLSEPE